MVRSREESGMVSSDFGLQGQTNVAWRQRRGQGAPISMSACKRQNHLADKRVSNLQSLGDLQDRQ